MPDTPFETTIRQLFDTLRLGAPRFDETGLVRLRIDDLAVNLSADGRGGVAIEGRAGALSADPRRRAAQRGDILRANAGLLLVNEAGTTVEAGPGAGVSSVVVRLTHRPGARALADAIDDVLALMEHHRAILARHERGPAAQRPAPPMAATGVTSDEAIIFRP